VVGSPGSAVYSHAQVAVLSIGTMNVLVQSDQAYLPQGELLISASPVARQVNAIC